MFYVHPNFDGSSFAKAKKYAKDKHMVVIEKLLIHECMTPNTDPNTDPNKYLVMDNSTLVLDNSTIRGKFSTYQEAVKFVESLIKSYYTFEPSEKRRKQARESLIWLKKMRSHDSVFGKDVVKEVEKEESFESELEEYVYSKEFHDHYQKIVIDHHS